MRACRRSRPATAPDNGVLGVLPASSLTQAPIASLLRRRCALCRSAPPAQPQAAQQNSAVKPPAGGRGPHRLDHPGRRTRKRRRSRQRIDLARNKASGLLSKADPFTEPVVAKDNRKLFRARFAGLERDQAEAVCRTLKRADISCITVRN